MNAVEIEEAISQLAEQPFEAEEFPFAFLQAFGNRETTTKRLPKGESNRFDLGGVLQTNNIRIFVAAPSEVTKTLAALKASPATARAKEIFALATDAGTFEVEDPTSGELVACARAHQGYDYSPALRATNQQKQRDALSAGPDELRGKINESYRSETPHISQEIATVCNPDISENLLMDR